VIASTGITVWGSCLTVLAVAAVVLLVQAVLAEVDRFGVLSYLLGAVTAVAGVTLMLDV
jgi:hypothetical protein